MTETALLDQAAALIKDGRNDQAIDLLRGPEAPSDAARCRLLALAYYQRGDSKGDVYASHFFAARAMVLGDTSLQMQAVKAIGAFRKGRYAEAAADLAGFVTPDSPPAQQFLYGLALHAAGRSAAARPWLDAAAVLAPQDPLMSQGRHVLDTWRYADGRVHLPASADMVGTAVERARASGLADIEAPYRHHAVSKLRGHGTAPKDFDWLRRNVPCQAACPAGTDIPEYLAAIYQGEFGRAYRINLRDNVFPGVLGRVCARPCEAACRHGWPGLGESVAICWSKRAAADLMEPGPVVLDPLAPPTGKRVAVVGAGVAGLATARELARLGHAVEVFEKHSRPGGMLNQGIPEFRLPREIVDREIAQIEALGVRLTCGVCVGRDLPLSRLRAGFDAVVLAAGTLRPNLLDLPGKELDGIHHGLGFLLAVNEGVGFQVGRQVIVIGGGFTAMDCARAAWRLQAASVRVLYRRSRNEMLITPGELEELEQEGIPMEFLVSPVAYLGDAAGQVRAMRFSRNALGSPDADGRRRPVPIPGSEFELPVDTVLLATGQFPDTTWIDPDLRSQLVASDGWLAPGTGHAARTVAGIFFAGDFATGASSLIAAIGHAKRTVAEVDAFLMGRLRLRPAALVEDCGRTGRIREMDGVPRQSMPALAVADRTPEAEVELGYDAAGAVDETQRCYRCNVKFEIDTDRCIYCDWCIKVKPRPACILRLKEITYTDDGRVAGWVEAASSEETTLIHINQEDCIRCHACVDACPVDCIGIQKVSSCTLCR